MTQHTDKSSNVQDGNTANGEPPMIEVETKPAEPAPLKGQPAPASGGGLVWVLAVLIVVGGGGYAAWPYYGHLSAPYVKQARALLGLQARPTQPSLPGSALDARAVATPAPTSAPVTASSAAVVEPLAPPREAEFEAAPLAAPEPVFAPTPMPMPMPTPMPPAPMASGDGVEGRSAPSPDVAPILNSLTTRLDILESQLNAAIRDGGPGNTGGDTQDATGRLAQTLSALQAQIATLNTRLNALETAPRGLVDPSASAQALVLSVTQLRTQALGDGPFDAALDALERIGAADPVIVAALARLRPYGPSGVPTATTLRAEFNAVAAEVMRVHGQSTGRGWWGEVRNTLSGLVSVRRTDPARIDDAVERALAIAEQALGQGDLKTAVAALASLQGSEAAAANTWRQAALARVEVQDALDVLHAHAVTALSTTGATTGSTTGPTAGGV